MKIAGLVCEFNPLHLGHEYIVNKIKEDNVDLIISVMSPNFTMRGEMAIINKMDRAKLSLEKGVDIVAEIPTICAIESADNYALKAIEILSLFNITDIYFGAEYSDINSYYKIINIRDGIEYKKYLEEYKNKGYNLKDASKKAILKIDESLKDILESPNSLLALEYINAINKKKLNIIPHIIKRIETGYYDEINKDKIVQSASAIRNEYFISKKSIGLSYDLSNYKTYNIKDYFELIRYKISSSSIDELKNIKGINEGIENLLKKNAYIEEYDTFINSLVSKRNRETKIKRILAYILLNIKRDETINWHLEKVRILGVNEKGRKILRNFSPEKYIINIERNTPPYILRELDFSRIYYKGDEDLLKNEYHPIILK